jgi:deoxycytidylate deaminase
MNPKHIALRVEQCLVLAKASNCPRRKFGALLLDPVRNVILMDGYNGGPRGGGPLCAGSWCSRDGVPTDHSEYTIDPVTVRHRGDMASINCVIAGNPVRVATLPPESCWSDKASFQATVTKQIDAFIQAHPPVESGTRIEVGCHHAEMNVVCNAAANGVKTTGAWLIVTGEPCLLCAKLIHHAGITKVLCVKGGYKGGDGGVSYLNSNHVYVEYVDGPLDPRVAPSVEP